VTAPAKHHRGCEQNQSIDAIGHARRRMDGDDGSQAGPDEDDRSGGDGNDGIRQLVEHPRQRQRRKIRLVEIWTMKRDTVRLQALAKVRGLGRLRRRSESVQEEHLHQRSR
jgi:hypothetical protein